MFCFVSVATRVILEMALSARVWMNAQLDNIRVMTTLCAPNPQHPSSARAILDIPELELHVMTSMSAHRVKVAMVTPHVQTSTHRSHVPATAGSLGMV